MASFSHKRGDTFSLAGPGTLPSGIWTATAQLRDPLSDRKIAEMDVQLAAQPSGNYTHLLSISAAASVTRLWPIASLSMDVQFVDDTGIVRSTQTQTIAVVRDITHD